MTLFEVIIIAIVEGITEFLPISSTGHMIIAQKLLGVESSEFVNLFIVNIQFGAILSVVVLYWKRFAEPLRIKLPEGNPVRRFLQRYDFYLKLLVAFLPAAVFGLAFHKAINKMLDSVLVVAISLVLGGIVLVFVDKWFRHPSEKQELSFGKSLTIGFFQVISMIPGVSRAAATIIGGLTQKLNRKNAAEFSFFLAVPTMLAASVLELFNAFHGITVEQIKILILGNVVAFAVAVLAIKGFITLLSRQGFRMFGFYRILVGSVILLMLALGVDLNRFG
jgi:undecaprenyl-diphosphatase